MYDIIGDIHGYANSLKSILEILGYENSRGFYRHATRKAIFTGDFIDRGPMVVNTLKIVKAMVDNNSAMAIMGNHEYNAICYHTKDAVGNYLREHSEKNRRQYRHTLYEFENSRNELMLYINWFKTLPLFIEIDNLRVVHACWDNEVVNFIRKSLPTYTLNWNFLLKSSVEGTKEFNAIEVLLKGKEIRLPKNVLYVDKDGIRRKSVRIKWWNSFNSETYRSIAVNFSTTVPNVLVENDILKNHVPYFDYEPPVFVGHYWRSGEPEIIKHNVCCVDFSVARHGKLVAYRWDGESNLDNSKFVYVKSMN